LGECNELRIFVLQELDASDCFASLSQFAFECCLQATFELSNDLTHPLRTTALIKNESEIQLKIFHCFFGIFPDPATNPCGSCDEELQRTATKSGKHGLYESNVENAAESKYEI
jgi:hypothetical protein